MTRSRFLASALLLGAATSACDVADSTAPQFGANGSDPVTEVLASVNTSIDPRTPNTGGSLFDRLAAEIKSFGGLYRNGHCAVAVVLTDMTEADHAIRVVKAALEPLRGCPNGLRVHAVQGTYTYIELQRFGASARELMRIDGVRGVHISYQLNKLVVGVSSRAVAKQVMDALPTLNIPNDAVTFVLTGDRERSIRGPSAATPPVRSNR